MPRPVHPPRKDGNERLCRAPNCDNIKRTGTTMCTRHLAERYYSKERMIKSSDRDEQGRKYCYGCSGWHPVTEYHKGGKGRPDGLRARCKACSSVEYKARNYGIGKDRLKELLQEQQGACAICGDTEMGTRWAVDHDHSCCPTTKSCGTCVRGILCVPCNTAMGILGDNVTGVMRAVTYLRRYEESVVG